MQEVGAVMAKVILQQVAMERGWTEIAPLARKADLNYRTVYELWHNPARDASLRTLEKLAIALGVSVKDLIEDDEVLSN
jgi:DNA-binding Xre family transcriptional regulator